MSGGIEKFCGYMGVQESLLRETIEKSSPAHRAEIVKLAKECIYKPEQDREHQKLLFRTIINPPSPNQEKQEGVLGKAGRKFSYLASYVAQGKLSETATLKEIDDLGRKLQDFKIVADDEDDLSM